MVQNSYTSSFNFLKILVFLIAIILIFKVVGNEYETIAGQNKINEWSKERFEEFYNLPNNTLDIAFIGSSHSYCSFDPENFDSKLGTSSFQLGMPQQTPDSSYYTVKELFKYQKPKLVVMELYWDILENDFEIKQVETFFKVLKDEEMKKDYLKNIFPFKEKIKFNIKAIRMQQDFFAFKSNEINKDFKEKTSFEKEEEKGSEYYDSKGYIFCDYIMSTKKYLEIGQTPVKDYDFKMSEVQEGYLNKIIELCKENNTELIFVTAPISNISLSKISDYEEISKTFENFSHSNDVKYLDFNKANLEYKLFDDNKFRDAGHLNDSGGKIASEYLINFFNLKDKF